MTIRTLFRFLFAFPLAFIVPVGTAFDDMPITDIFVIGFFAVGMISGAFRLVRRLADASS